MKPKVLIVAGFIAALVTVSVSVAREPDLSAEAKASIALRQAVLDQENDARKQGLANPAPILDSPDPPSASPPDPWPEGIFGKEEADFPPSHGQEFENIWRQVISGQNVVVYAGGEMEGDPPAGVVMVVTVDPQTWGHTFEDYPTPIPGPVKIERAVGNQLFLTSLSNSSQTVFDVVNRTFLDP